jgi:anti-anti-sigma factor
MHVSLLVDIQHQGTRVILKVKGIMDITTLDIFSEAIDQLPENLSRLTLDFGDMEFIDSTGIGAIIELIYMANEMGFSIDLQGIDEQTNQIFEIVGLYQILEALQKEEGR